MTLTGGATERRGLEETLGHLPEIQRRTERLIRRITAQTDLPEGARVLDVGAAQGLHVVALRRLGFEAEGVEPWSEAIAMAGRIAESVGVPVPIRQGVAESLPWPAGSFDLVLAVSVLEHVDDPKRVFAEVHRVLRPGGAFYFYTSSALSPRQNEIRRFPAFGWYPLPVKRAIMRWAMRRRPRLVGHTERPAMHWYTPWGVRRDLRRTGFHRVVDRWQLKRDDEVDGWRRTALRAVRSSEVTRRLVDVAVPESGWLAVR